ncbi:MAG: N-6 DNA methylase, partial [Tissierellia bacterium]|nr:N-6 DNA methylase [Tissierellia bacterium]
YDYISKVKYVILLICYELYCCNFNLSQPIDSIHIFRKHTQFNLQHTQTEEKISVLIKEFSNNLPEDFYPSYLYEDLLTAKEKNSLGQVYTPLDIVNRMIKQVFKIKNVNENTKILDPACGGGYFLVELYKYIRNNHPAINKRHIVETMLYGIDIDDFSIFLSKMALIFQSGLNDIKLNIQNRDFLLAQKTSEKFDIIIANPPYLGHKNTTKEYKKVLYEKYDAVFYDKADISYCFFKQGKELLKAEGVISFITSRYFMEALYGDRLRSFLKENFKIISLVDYNGNRLFKRAMISPAIITLCNSGNKSSFLYVKKNSSSKEVYKYDQNKLKDKGWVILKDVEEKLFDRIDNISNTYIKDISTIKQGIITGLDKAFIVTEEDIEKYKIESFLLRKWIKNSNISRSSIKYNNLYLLYSDIIENEEDFPNAINYLALYKERLKNRRECLNGIRQWYKLQWGRNKSDFENPKIIFPYKSKSNNFYYDPHGYFCSADIYLMNNFPSNISIDYLTSYLNSEIFEFYLKCQAKKVGPNLYEYYPNKLNDLKIYIPQENIQQKFSQLGKFSIEILLKKMFNVSDEEVNIIKKYI